jgi:hypothetical protein
MELLERTSARAPPGVAVSPIFRDLGGMSGAQSTDEETNSSHKQRWKFSENFQQLRALVDNMDVDGNGRLR